MSAGSISGRRARAPSAESREMAERAAKGGRGAMDEGTKERETRRRAGGRQASCYLLLLLVVPPAPLPILPKCRCVYVYRRGGA